MAGHGFAVLDLETTGLFPDDTDRVVEIAVVHLSAEGRVEGRWESLVDPGRDLGRTDLHRIRPADVGDAPAFAAIAPRLVELLRGRVVVAHNATFHTGFLLAELARAGQPAPAGIVTLCTMQLARDFLPGAGRSLSDSCAALDIDLPGGHSAAAAALSSARLLSAYIEAADAPEFWSAYLAAAAALAWSVPTRPGDPEWRARTVSAHPLAAASFLDRLTSRLPDVAGPAEYVDYLAMLDRCLLEGALSAHQAHAPERLAGALGLGAGVSAALHRAYYTELTELAWSDGILTAAELADLAGVGTLLGQPADTIAAALDETRHRSTPAVPVPVLGPDFTLLPGDMVVLTGEMSRTRSLWERELRGRGLVPWSGVTRRVTLLAAANVDSRSGKARKARDYGIPIVDEDTLARLAGLPG
jgi:DNA polymerase-3 subunit epsilon